MTELTFGGKRGENRRRGFPQGYALQNTPEEEYQSLPAIGVPFMWVVRTRVVVRAGLQLLSYDLLPQTVFRENNRIIEHCVCRGVRYTGNPRFEHSGRVSSADLGNEAKCLALYPFDLFQPL